MKLQRQLAPSARVPTLIASGTPILDLVPNRLLRRAQRPPSHLNHLVAAVLAPVIPVAANNCYASILPVTLMLDN
jgi:hypothetical protein